MHTHPGSEYPPADENYIRELEEYITKVSEPFGGIEALDAKFDLYLKAAKLLDKAVPMLRKQYPNRWVSMDEQGTLTVAGTVEELIEMMAEQGLRSGDYPCVFLQSQSRNLTL